MHIEPPAFSPKLFGYDPESVDRAVDWAVDRIRQDDPLEESEVNALRFQMARRNGYEPQEVDDWFDSLRNPIASQVHAGSSDADPTVSQRAPFEPPAFDPPPSPEPPHPRVPSDPEVPAELRGASLEPTTQGGHRTWAQLTALILIVALLGLFIVSYFI